MITQAQKKLNEKTYMELGRFVVNFSVLLQALEFSTARFISKGPHPSLTKVLAVLANRTAEPINTAFFTMYFDTFDGHLRDEERAILKCLRKEIQNLIEKRNRLMHDTWLGKSVGGDPGPHQLSKLRTRTHSRGVDFETEDYSPEALKNLAERATQLKDIVYSLSMYSNPNQAIPELELDKRLEVINGEVQRIDKNN